MPDDATNESRLNRYKDRLNDSISDAEALKLILKLRGIRPITFQLLQKTGIGAEINDWRMRNLNRLEKSTLRQAEKLINGWKQEMQKTRQPESSSEASSSDESDREDIKSEPNREIKTEPLTEPQYSPGGNSPEGNSPAYVPTPVKKKKPYRPGGFFLDDDDDEDEEEDEQANDFIEDEEEDEDDENPFFQANALPQFDDDMDDIDAMLAAEQAKIDTEEKKREEAFRENAKQARKEAKRKQMEKEERAQKEAKKEEKRRAEKQKKKEEARRLEKLEKEKAERKAQKKLAEKRKLELEEHEKRKAKKRKKEAEEKQNEIEKNKLKEKEERRRREQVEKERRREREEKERRRAQKEKIKSEIKTEIKTEPVTDPFDSSGSDVPDSPDRRFPENGFKTEPPTSSAYANPDPFSDSDQSDDEIKPSIKSEPVRESSPPMPPPSGVLSESSKLKLLADRRKGDKKPVPLVKLAEKSKKRKDLDKKKKKKNLVVTEEMDTTGFSFDAMLTMNTAKVKKSKKAKPAAVNEHDESVLEFEEQKTQNDKIKKKSAQLKEVLKKKKADEMTDEDAALLATTRKRGLAGGQLLPSQKKIKYVSKVHRLFDLSLKTIKNYPNYLLAPHEFMYPADIIMPAMEKLNEKCLHQLEKMQPQLTEDTNHIWRGLCYGKFGAKSSESVEGSGETWKEGFLRLSNEQKAKLKQLTKKITKKTEKEEKKNLKSKLAFVQGHVKAPRSVRAAQMKYGTGNDIRNKKYDVHIPGITNKPSERYTSTSGQVKRGPAPIGNRVNIASDSPHARRPDRPGTSSSSNNKKKPAPLMKKALAGIRGYKR